ncbi:MAG: ABC-three component system protein [Chloroflexota bacterium]
MIRKIYSDLPSFKTLEFYPGLNILLADKSQGATDKHTRNGAGKTSLIELIHFFLGHEPDKGTLFRKKALEEHTFGIDFDLSGERTIVERTGSKPSKIYIVEASPDYWPILPEIIDDETGRAIISNTNWKRVLGNLIFDLSIEEEKLGKFGPTFRAMISYFVRRVENDGFLEPVSQSRWQLPWDYQVNISYLFGLDWTVPQQWETVRKKEKTLDQVKKAARDEDLLESVLGKSSELRTQLFVTQADAEQIRTGLRNFRVLPQYHDLEREASQLAQAISGLANENTIDRQLVDDLSGAVHSEETPSFDELQRLFEEAGVILPDSVVMRFEDVRIFHESIINNRHSYLDGEITNAQRRITEREKNMEKLDERRSEVMSILSSGGALEQQDKLHSELSRVEGEISALQQRFAAAEQVESLAAELEAERNQLLRRLQQDFREQSDVLRQAVSAFENVSKALYERERAGSLLFDATANGPKFEITIPADKSKGIRNMQIFCFDMTLMQLVIERGMGPGFLIHDSHLFDGVDSRQIAKALEVGAKFAEELGFQYIVTMNSDDMPWREFSDGFNAEQYVLSQKLTDATEDGGLFGIRFN